MKSIIKCKYFNLMLLLPVILIGGIGMDVYRYNKSENISIYLDTGNIGPQFDSLAKNHGFESVTRFTNSMISDRDDGYANLGLVSKYLKLLFPNENDTGICIIDWEGRPSENLKKYTKGDDKYRFQMAEYLSIVRKIKSLRPNLKVGIYNIPFRNYSWANVASQIYNYKLLYPLLDEVDYIVASPYITYPDKEMSLELKEIFIPSYLSQALLIKEELNKPLLGYISVRYSGINTNYKDQFIPFDEFRKCMQIIINTTKDNTSLDDIVIWEWKKWEAHIKTLPPFEGLSIEERAVKYDDLMKQYLSILSSIIEDKDNKINYISE